MYYKEVSEPFIRKSFPMFIRVIMTLSVILRICFFLEFAASLAFQDLYDLGVKDYPKEEQKKLICMSCTLYGLAATTLSSLYILIDVFFLGNAIGAYVRHHYGAGVDDSDKQNLRAVIELNEENPSLSARCFGFGCCNGIGAIYQRSACKDMVRAENSQCEQLGNYMCLAVFPFSWTAGCARRFGYENTVLINFIVTILYFCVTTAALVMCALCYFNKTYCMSFSSSISSSFSH